MPRHGRRALRHRLYEILEHGPVGDRVGRLVGRLIVLLIVINLVAITLESIPEFEAQYTALFIAIELVSLAVFTVEYGLRMWVAVEQAPYLHSDGWKARLRYATSPIGVIDLLAVLPFWLAVVLPAEFKILLVFRIIRFLKLARYSPGMRSLLDVLYAERRALFGCLVIFIGATLVSATIMHILERHVQPEKFGTIPDAMWWAIVTLGTIGYGDVVPVTPLGRIIAAATIFAGLIMVALPVGIVATAFANEIHRRDFVVTWGMVARVPLFSEPQRGGDRRYHALAARPEDRGGPGARAPRRARAFHVFRGCGRGRDRAQASACTPRCRSLLRRDRGAASRPPFRDDHCGHADQPASARCPRFARFDGSRTAHRRPNPRGGARTSRPRSSYV